MRNSKRICAVAKANRSMQLTFRFGVNKSAIFSSERNTIKRSAEWKRKGSG